MLTSLKIYTVHVKDDVVRASEKPVFLREGFNIWAFLFTGFWALYHRLWVPMFGIIAFNIVLIEIAKQHILGSIGVTVVQLAFNALVAFQANDWRRASLSKRGYLFADITTGDNLLNAERRYLERYVSSLNPVPA